MNEGKKDRRDPIRTVKPRNFVAKNAMTTTSGAGAHKDKKKAMKQGDVKHKKQEYAESLQKKLDSLVEEFNAEYDDESGMSHGSLHTIERAAAGLMDVIKDGDNLPEWCQEKISLAEDYLVTVWDYIQSEKAQGVTEFAPAGSGGGNTPRGPSKPGRGPWDDNDNDPYEPRRYKHSIDFFDQFDIEGFDKKKFDKATGEFEGYYFDRDAPSGITQIAYFKFDDPKKIGDNDSGMGWYYEPMDEGVAEGKIDEIKKGQKDSNGFTKCRTGYVAKGTKKSPSDGEPVRNCVPKESWTHDSLAAQLFETENTYEDRLKNLLNKKLGK